MVEVVSAKTASRQVLGVMNEFRFMAEHSISTGRSDPADLAGLSVWLANSIVGPISKKTTVTNPWAPSIGSSPRRAPQPEARTPIVARRASTGSFGDRDQNDNPA